MMISLFSSVSSDSPASIATCLPLQAIYAFFGDDGHHRQPRNGIGPPPAQNSIQHQPAQKDGRQVCTEIRLSGVGVHGTANDSGSDSALRFRQYRHHHDGGSGDQYSGNAPFRRFVANERGAGFIQDVAPQGKETPAHNSQRCPFKLFTPRRIELPNG